MGLLSTLTAGRAEKQAELAFIHARDFHRLQEILVRFGGGELFHQELHRLDRGQRRQHFAEHPHAVQVFFRDQELFFSRAALLDVNRGEDAAVGELAIDALISHWRHDDTRWALLDGGPQDEQKAEGENQ